MVKLTRQGAALLLLPFILLWGLPVFALGRGEDPHQLLAAHYQALGGLERLKAIRSSYSSGTRRYDGLKGHFEHWEEYPLRYRTETDYGIIHQVEGDSGEVSWYLDTNGQPIRYLDEQTLLRRQLSLLLENYEHLKPESPHFRLRWLGTREIDGAPCHELLLQNTINDDESRFFLDTQSLLARRVVHHLPDMEVIVTPQDYRWVDGILLAHHEHSLYLPWQKEEEVWLEKYQAQADVSTVSFAVPEPADDVHLPPGKSSTQVAFALVENLLYLPVTIGSETTTWVLDSGASMSLIDQEYAAELGLETGGSIRGYGFGELFELNFAKVPGFSVGEIRFDPQVFYVSHGLRQGSYEPEIAGILGYDFLSRFVVELDYHRQLATFHLPQSFTYDGPGQVIDAPLKYRTFTLPVRLENRHDTRWSIDLGSHQASLYYPFAKKANLLNRPGILGVSQGLAGLAWDRTAVFSCIAIGDYSLDAPLISIPLEEGEGATALAEVGGNLGNSVLRNFHIYLNYPRQQVILEPGPNFNDQPAVDGSGLLLGRSEEEHRPMISYVAPGSPGEIAGLIAGDLLLQMNGMPIAVTDPVIPLRHILRGKPGSTIPLQVQRDGQQLETTLTLADLYPREDQNCQTAP